MVTNTYQTRKRWIRACKSRLADTAESGAPILPFSAHSATKSDLPVRLERIFSTTQHGDLESYYCRLSEVSFFLLLISKTRLKGVFLISVNPLRRLLRSSMNLLADDREPPHVYIGSNISESSPVPFGSSRSSSPIPQVSPIRLGATSQEGTREEMETRGKTQTWNKAEVDDEYTWSASLKDQDLSIPDLTMLSTKPETSFKK